MQILRDCRVGKPAFLWVLFACAVPAAVAAELNPYSLPSQQRFAPPAPNVSVQEQRGAIPATITESYYERFETQAKTLKPDQRTQVRRTFSQKRDETLKAGRLNEAQHYARLVQILDAIK